MRTILKLLAALVAIISAIVFIGRLLPHTPPFRLEK